MAGDTVSDTNKYGEPLKYDPDFSGPYKHRSCTDILCFLLFIVFIGCWIGVALYAIRNGDPNVLLVPKDSHGSRCGFDTHVADKPYLFFFDLTKCLQPIPFSGCKTPQVCVKECPSKQFLLNNVVNYNPNEMICVDNLKPANKYEAENLARQGKCAIWYLKSVSVNSLENNSPVVETSLGKIKGQHKKSYGGRIFSAFEGIPYAKPPIGDLRFQAPSDVEPWSEIWDATTSHMCIQPHMLFKTSLIGDEDCLYLNVYVPREKVIANEHLDVIVHIHGGGLTCGGPSLAGPEFLMDRNIVYVNFSYRLGVLGFFYTGDSTVSGNNGLKDQVHALLWVQSHIAKFGGNPKSVTIIGTSAGGISVHLHYFSPMSKGLFHRGISQSGTVLIPIAVDPSPFTTAIRFGNASACPIASPMKLVECLRGKSAHELTSIAAKLVNIENVDLIMFNLVLEKNVNNAFMINHPHDMLIDGKFSDLPWMSSVTTGEGLILIAHTNGQLDTITKNWYTAAPKILKFSAVEEKLQDEVSRKIKEFYDRNTPVSSSDIVPILKMFGDRFFVLGMEKSARLHAKFGKSPVYVFQFGYLADYDTESPHQLNDSVGVNHGADGCLLYNVSYDGFYSIQNKLSDSDEKIKEIQLDIVTSFAKIGQPQVKGIYNWAPIRGNSPDFRYLYIGNDGVKVNVTKELAPTEFWQSLPIIENLKKELKEN